MQLHNGVALQQAGVVPPGSCGSARPCTGATVPISPDMASHAPQSDPGSLLGRGPVQVIPPLPAAQCRPGHPHGGAGCNRCMAQCFDHGVARDDVWGFAAGWHACELPMGSVCAAAGVSVAVGGDVGRGAAVYACARDHQVRRQGAARLPMSPHRFVSSCPALYWWAAASLLGGRQGCHTLLTWWVGYAVVGAAAFSNFLPWC